MGGHAPTLSSRRLLLSIAGTGLFVFVVLAVLVAAHPEPFAVDEVASRAAEGIRNGALTVVMRAASTLGSTVGIVVEITLFAVATLLLRREANLTRLLVLTSIGGWLASHGFKALLDRPRPSLGLVEASGASFPSGHATQGGAYFVMLALVVAALLPRRWRAIGFALPLATGVLSAISRVYLRVHWVTDVIAGFALGVTLCTLVLLHSQTRFPAGSPPDRP